MKKFLFALILWTLANVTAIGAVMGWLETN